MLSTRALHRGVRSKGLVVQYDLAHDFLPKRFDSRQIGVRGSLVMQASFQSWIKLHKTAMDISIRLSGWIEANEYNKQDRKPTHRGEFHSRAQALSIFCQIFFMFGFESRFLVSHGKFYFLFSPLLSKGVVDNYF